MLKTHLGSRWDPKCVFNFLRFFERTLYESNYIIFISSWCGTHTKIRSKLVDIVTAGSQKNHPLGSSEDPPPLGILRVKTRATFIRFSCVDSVTVHFKTSWYSYTSSNLDKKNRHFTRSPKNACTFVFTVDTGCVTCGGPTGGWGWRKVDHLTRPIVNDVSQISTVNVSLRYKEIL